MQLSVDLMQFNVDVMQFSVNLMKQHACVDYADKEGTWGGGETAQPCNTSSRERREQGDIRDRD